MSVEYTVYANIEAYDESKIKTSEDDCWHPSDEWNLAVFDTLEEAEAFMTNLPTELDIDLVTENKRLRDALEDVIRFTPNDTDFKRKPTRDECLKEIKFFAEQALEAKDCNNETKPQ